MSYPEQISNLEKSFYLTLEGYKNTYIQKARDDTNENKNLFNQAEGRLNGVFRDLITLRSNISSTIGVNKNNIAAGNAQITVAENSWNNSKKKLRNQYGTNLAAKPLKHDTNIEKNDTYLTSLFYILGIITIVTLIIKQFKSNNLPTATAFPVAKAVAV